jgi:hypothetical protein
MELAAEDVPWIAEEMLAPPRAARSALPVGWG